MGLFDEMSDSLPQVQRVTVPFAHVWGRVVATVCAVSCATGVVPATRRAPGTATERPPNGNDRAPGHWRP